LSDIYEYSKKQGAGLFSKVKQIPPYNLLALGLLPLLSYFLFDDEFEEYPINYFEAEIEKNNSMYQELSVKIKLDKEEVHYRIEFMKDSRKHFITIYNDVARFKGIINKLSSNVVVKYEYQPNFELKMTNVHTVANIISVIFITAFFLRSSNMGSVKKGSTKMGGLNDLLNKKTFDVITDSKVRFADVAGLD
jgi:ATP-dependent Zn protease